MIVDSLIHQHKEALEVAGKIAAQFDGNTVKNPDEVRSLLSTLLGKLTIHLAMEDKNLYPKAEASGDTDLAKMSVKLRTEMSGLADAVVSYGKKWPSGSAIAANQAAFITETKGVFDALAKRIQVEERDFYPLATKKL
ncbi:MAG TPA: hemerythrin domain-containing protein [Alphaproteobacteria bacterium]|nr:hemerythrin domain-containing protein [Alphaproteobacteria bacterium]HNS44882.1 hemerythrin domain-containing protein [Alphaproteobacteria bacterium]